MKLSTDDYSKQILLLVCLIKVYHDAGIRNFDHYYGDEISVDYYYDFVMEAIQSAAPIVIYDDNLYAKHGYEEDNGEVYIWAYSSKEMQEYFRIARKLYRLEGCKTKENPYIAHIKAKAESIRGFHAYNFDYFYGHLRKGARLEVLWGYDFDCEIPMCLWIVRVMTLIKEELPILKEKYRKARREKRCRKGGLCHAS